MIFDFDIDNSIPASVKRLFRVDDRGFILQRATENKLVVTCRYVSVLMSAILKAKAIHCLSRAGFALYFDENESVFYVPSDGFKCIL